MSELKPCPCCGSGPARGPGQYTSASFSGVEIMDPTNQPYVWCGTCGLRTRACDSQAEAIETWNTRPLESVNADLLEALDRAVTQLRHLQMFPENSRNDSTNELILILDTAISLAKKSNG